MAQRWQEIKMLLAFFNKKGSVMTFLMSFNMACMENSPLLQIVVIKTLM